MLTQLGRERRSNHETPGAVQAERIMRRLGEAEQLQLGQERIEQVGCVHAGLDDGTRPKTDVLKKT